MQPGWLKFKTDVKRVKTALSPTAVDAFRYLMLIEEQSAITTAKAEALKLINELKETYKDNKELASVLEGARGTLDAASDETKIKRIITTLTMVKANGGDLDAMTKTSASEDKKLVDCRSTLATRLAQIKTDVREGKTALSPTAVDAFRYLMLIEEQSAITTAKAEALILINELKETYKDNKRIGFVLEGARGTLDAASDETKIKRIITTLTMVKANGGDLDAMTKTSASEDKKLVDCRSTLATRLAQIKTDVREGKTALSPTAVDAFRYLMLIEEQSKLNASKAATTTPPSAGRPIVDEVDIKRRLSQVKDMACRGEVKHPTSTTVDSLISCYRAFAEMRPQNRDWYADKIRERPEPTSPSSAKPSQVILEFKTKDDLMEFVSAK